MKKDTLFYTFLGGSVILVVVLFITLKKRREQKPPAPPPPPTTGATPTTPQAGTASPQGLNLQKLLKENVTGDEVRKLQTDLKTMSGTGDIDIDGVFGPQTKQYLSWKTQGLTQITLEQWFNFYPNFRPAATATTANTTAGNGAGNDYTAQDYAANQIAIEGAQNQFGFGWINWLFG